MTPRSAGRWLAAALVCAGVAVRAAENPRPTVPAGEEIVELPPLEVIAPGKPPPPWQYAALGSTEVLSRCSASLTREFIETHGRLIQLLQLLLPLEFQAKYSAPQIIILTDQTTTPAAAREAIAGFLAEKKEPGDSRLARENNVRFVPNLRLNDPDVVAVYAILDARTFQGDRLVLTPSHVRDVIERRTPPLPAWYIVGVLKLFQDMQFLREAIEFEPLGWTSSELTEHLRRDPDFPRTLLPIRELLAGTTRREIFAEAEARRLWEAQAALLVRWALDGEEPARRDGFWRFVARAAAEGASEAALQECLGLSYADLRDRLSDYLPGALRQRLRVRAEKLLAVPAFTLQLASPAEIGRIKGDWERMEIAYVKARYPQVTERYMLQAHRTLAEAYDKGARDPQFLGVIGLYEADVGNAAAARNYLEEAARAKIVRPRVYLELARLRYLEETAGLERPEQKLSAAQANHVLAPMATAWTQSPPLADAFLLVADVWVHSAAVLEPRQFALIDEGRRLFPGQGGLTYYAALLKITHGDTAGAELLIREGEASVPTASGRAKFEQLRTYLNRRREPAKP